MEQDTKTLLADLGKAIVRDALLNTATTIGVLGGLIAVAAVAGKIQELKSSKKTITE